MLIFAQFPSAFLKWCGSFLRNHQRRDRANGFISTLRNVTPGVPQGCSSLFIFKSYGCLECHRIICGNDCRCDALESLDSRRERIVIKLFLKSMKCDNIIRDIMPDFLPSSRRLRLPSLTQRRSSSFIPSCTAIYNNKFS